MEEIQRPVSENRGYFIKGKFDQYLRTTPYTAITQAFAEFVSRILAEPEKSFNEWQEKIQSAVGDLGQVLTDVIPALEDLIGAQPEVPQLGGQEAENRFNYVFINFLLTVATEKHPLVLFIDDLQWIDAASLRLLKVIRSDFNQPGLLVIGAYRDNEVDASHPLMGFIGDPSGKSGKTTSNTETRIICSRKTSKRFCRIRSDPRKASKSWVRLFTKRHRAIRFSPAGCCPLYMKRAVSVHDSEIKGWKWDIEDINAAGIADNVADLLAKKVAQLPEETQNI